MNPSETARLLNETRQKEKEQLIKGRQRELFVKYNTSSTTEVWDKMVDSEEKALLFYETFYPEYPQPLQQALAQTIGKIVRGECEISGEVYKKLLKAKQQKETINKNKSDKGEHGDNDDDYTTFGKWNFKGELENEKNKGKVEVARKRLAQVLEEETKK